MIKRSVLSVTDSVVNEAWIPPKRSDFSKHSWLLLNKPSHRSKRSRSLATRSTTEPPDRAASQQKFTSMPSESCFMCVLPATEGGERRKGLKRKKRVCRVQLRAETQSFLATCSARWNWGFCGALWIFFIQRCSRRKVSYFIFNAYVPLKWSQSSGTHVQPHRHTHTHTHTLSLTHSMNFHQQISQKIVCMCCFHCNLSLCLRPVES